ncbi:GntR family transcriptional regulator [Paenibacillus mucilaginosus]|uniref:GntR family transcriptional regulator n=2 Tax=Paenibacillus mucilaginosus TaxID=61624 RepID=I0BHG7_9BACL|nr:GntR family transcriptional regulator [Paenibacillus mucilaginosus]AEI41065.1 GntR family transcriptional regulator [Paenibacillus mucilaginosus KNP414]AFH61814.1 GntR family transcriptional regulator [Paenibacillus mucilaginosus K02]MCG7211492.1 GntR family transcriptional regulator [Paenibacillus mucilaginosus]WDM30133.1 GntR family transcriptional regulator [Paenibacillus mucilaginosus]
MNVIFNNRDPVYLQVIRHFKEEIVTGRMAAGQEIPSRRELAALLQINPNTAQRAYKEMEEQKLITTEGNSPSRITTDEELLSLLREELLREAVDAFVDSVSRISVPVEELLSIVRQKYEAKQQHREQEDDGDD